MESYSISATGKPWLVLFSSSSLDAVAEAVAAHPDIEPSSIYVTRDGKPRGLTHTEQLELFGRVLELQPGNSVAMAQLSAIRAARQLVPEELES